MHHAGFRMVYPCSVMIFMGLRKVYWFCFVAAVTSDRWDDSTEYGVLSILNCHIPASQEQKRDAEKSRTQTDIILPPLTLST